MDKHKIVEYLEKIPVEIREPIMVLNNDQRWALFIALTLDKEMYFNEIKKVFSANPYTIDTNLKKLVASGLIAKKVKKISDLKNHNKIFYETTEFGNNFLMTICNIGLPKVPIEINPQILKEIKYNERILTVTIHAKKYVKSRTLIQSEQIELVRDITKFPDYLAIGNRNEPIQTLKAEV